MRAHSRHRLLTSLLSLALLLRIAVPGGLMPADTEDGWYLKFCPDGIPMQLAMALFGHDHAHHAHLAHQGHEQVEYAQCDLAGLVNDEVVACFVPAPPVELDLAADVPVRYLRLIRRDEYPPFTARAPPHAFS